MKWRAVWAGGICAVAAAHAGAQPGTPVVTAEQAIAALERSLDAELRRADQPATPGLAARMQQLPLRGLSIAVIHQGRVH